MCHIVPQPLSSHTVAPVFNNIFKKKRIPSLKPLYDERVFFHVSFSCHVQTYNYLKSLFSSLSSVIKGLYACLLKKMQQYTK